MVRLQAVGESIWLAEGEIVSFYGFPYPTRSVIVRLESGELWIWSPIRLSPDLRAEVDALGPVSHLVSPNKIHHLYLQEWKAVYAAARLWGPASTIRKRKDLSFHGVLDDAPPVDWRDEIEQFWFRGSFAFDEVVFVHRLSRTAIVADLSENFSEAFLARYWSPWKRTLARLWKITVDHGYPPLELRLSWVQRKPARKALEALLATHPKRVIMAHGEWQREDGMAYLQRSFAWLQREPSVARASRERP